MSTKNDISKKKAQQEIETVLIMIEMFCKGNHTVDSDLCEECGELAYYAQNKVKICPQMDNKPACRKCTIHCYDKTHRERIKKVMRYAGPRMLFHHPVRAIKHMFRR